MTGDEPCVEVRVKLRPSTYRAYVERAKDLGAEVPVLLSKIADRSVGRPDDPDTRPLVEQVRELHGRGMSDSKISRRLDITRPRVAALRESIGLQAAGRGGRRKAGES